jgi:hypothetical protein
MTRTAKALVAGLGLAIALAPAVPRRVLADAQQQQSFGVWRAMQDCARQALKQFPDHTPEGNAKRESARQECLRANHLPVTAAPPSAH